MRKLIIGLLATMQLAGLPNIKSDVHVIQIISMLLEQLEWIGDYSGT